MYISSLCLSFSPWFCVVFLSSLCRLSVVSLSQVSQLKKKCSKIFRFVKQRQLFLERLYFDLKKQFWDFYIIYISILRTRQLKQHIDFMKYLVQSLLLRYRVMVLILDSNSEIGAHVKSNLCFLTIFPKKRPIFLHACATYSELPPNISSMRRAHKRTCRLYEL